MLNTRRAVLTAAFVVLCGVVIAIASATSGAASSSSDPDSSNPDVSVSISAEAPVLPGAKVDLLGGGAAGETASIAVPTRTSAGLRSDASIAGGMTAAEVAELGWRASVIASQIASEDQGVTTWALDVDGVPSGRAENFAAGGIRSAPGAPVGWPDATRIGMTSPALAVEQLRSNIKALASVSGVSISAAVELLGLEAEAGEPIALEVHLDVPRLAELSAFVGDVFEGLATGLVGGPESTVAGLAIHVEGEDGAAASVWINGRTGSSSGIGNSQLSPVEGMVAAGSYRDLTGGPPTLRSVAGS